MGIKKASRLQAVLEKARNAGHFEESARIAGLHVVFSSLTAEAYNQILEDLEEVPELSYAGAYQVEHVCRSIVQIDEESLRDVQFVEVEAEGSQNSIKVERHQWLRDHIVSTWSREMLSVAFRKVMDAIKGAEERALEGVQFRIAEETDEEKYRRLLGELKETGAELPDDLRDAILREEGLAAATSKAEMEALDARTRAWAAEAESPPEPVFTPPENAQRESAAPVAPGAASGASAGSVVKAPQQLVDAQVAARPEPPAPRVPLNQTPIRDPVPMNPGEPAVVMAHRRSPVPPPDQVYDLSRSARVAALEEDPSLVVLDQRDVQVDHKQTQSILERGPVGGVNAKYVDPHSNPIRAGGLNPRRR